MWARFVERHINGRAAKHRSRQIASTRIMAKNPTPGTVIKRRQTASCWTTCRSIRCICRSPRRSPAAPSTWLRWSLRRSDRNARAARGPRLRIAPGRPRQSAIHRPAVLQEFPVGRHLRNLHTRVIVLTRGLRQSRDRGCCSPLRPGRIHQRLILDILHGEFVYARNRMELLQRRHDGSRQFYRRRSRPPHDGCNDNQGDSRNSRYHQAHRKTSLLPPKIGLQGALQGSAHLEKPLNSCSRFGERHRGRLLREVVENGSGSHRDNEGAQASDGKGAHLLSPNPHNSKPPGSVR